MFSKRIGGVLDLDSFWHCDISGQQIEPLETHSLNLDKAMFPHFLLEIVVVSLFKNNASHCLTAEIPIFFHPVIAV